MKANKANPLKMATDLLGHRTLRINE
jgi:hypothetical protein